MLGSNGAKWRLPWLPAGGCGAVESSRVLEALSRKPFAVVGHRCAAGEATENTLSALRRAVEDGADLVEVDVQVTRDGVPVLSHDENLRRVAGVDLDVRSASWEEVARVELPGGERVARLDEFLEAIHGVIPALVEVKHPEDTGVVLRHLEAHREWVAVISFHDEPVAEAARRGLVAGLIYARPPGRILDAKRLGARIVLPRYQLATLKAVTFAHRLGLKVVAWTVNSEQWAVELYRRGVDGIATDYPGRMAALRDRMAGGSTGRG